MSATSLESHDLHVEKCLWDETSLTNGRRLAPIGIRCPNMPFTVNHDAEVSYFSPEEVTQETDNYFELIGYTQMDPDEQVSR